MVEEEEEKSGERGWWDCVNGRDRFPSRPVRAKFINGISPPVTVGKLENFDERSWEREGGKLVAISKG